MIHFVNSILLAKHVIFINSPISTDNADHTKLLLGRSKYIFVCAVDGLPIGIESLDGDFVTAGSAGGSLVGEDSSEPLFDELLLLLAVADAAATAAEHSDDDDVDDVDAVELL